MPDRERPEGREPTPRRGFTAVVHDNVKLTAGIVVGVATVVTAVVGVAQLADGDGGNGTGGSAPGDLAAFCATWQSNATLNAVMSGFANQPSPPSREQVVQVSNELVRVSDRAAADAPAEIRANAREYARLQDQIARRLALNDFQLRSDSPEDALEVDELFTAMNDEMFTIEAWSRMNC